MNEPFPPPPANAARGFLFVLGHMRSQSSLLAHLLANHGDFAGHSELHRRYDTRADLSAMRIAIEERIGAPANARWLVDKVLHNHLPIGRGILARSDVRAIVLVRRPRATIASIVRVSREHVPGSVGNDPVHAGIYYVKRLQALESYEPHLAPRLAFVASERLVDAPDEVLGGLSRWLGLAQPLVPTYRTYPTTGRNGLGDPSEYIRAGRVLRDHERVDPVRDAIEVPADTLAEAQAAYDRAIARFSRWAVQGDATAG